MSNIGLLAKRQRRYKMIASKSRCLHVVYNNYGYQPEAIAIFHIQLSSMMIDFRPVIVYFMQRFSLLAFNGLTASTGTSL